MRDEIDSQMWIAHHEAFSRWIGEAGLVLRSALNRLAAWDGSTHQLLALALSFAITALTFNNTAA